MVHDSTGDVPPCPVRWTLLLLAGYEEGARPKRVLPKVSQTMLAGIVGTSRSRINQFLKKFKTLGFIDMDRGLTVKRSLLSVVLRD